MYGLTRRRLAVGVAVALAGCSTDEGSEAGGDGGGDGAVTGNPALASAEREGALILASPAFDNSEAIPRRYGRRADDVNPPLEVSDVPDAAESLALVVDDPDAVDVAGEIFVHWLVWNVPPETVSIPEDWTPETALEGQNDFREVGYGGPAPPEERHTYRLKCFALERTLDLEAGAGVEALGEAMAGRVVGRAQLEGTYEP